jgi:hypothetical protein
MSREEKHHDKIFELAVANGCQPIWLDGMFGWAWHCDCKDGLHYCDQQCSMITVKSAKSQRDNHVQKL